MLNRLLLLLCLSSAFSQAAADTQTKNLTIDKALINQIKALKPDTSNAHELELLLGPPAACLPTSPQAQESWICQWKGSLDSNRLNNTLNIYFEAGVIAHIQAID